MTKLDRWEQRERPDFAIWLDGVARPVGVEVTQLFPSEPHARLYLMKNYMESLWQGGRHRHREDVNSLKAARVTIHSPEGELKAEDVPVILTHPATEEDRRQALLAAIRQKKDRQYSETEFRHINLIVLDWHRIAFDADEIGSDQFYTRETKELLRTCPFNEVFLIVRSTAAGDADQQTAEIKYIFVRLMEFFLVSEYFLAAAAIARSSFAEKVTGPKHLARLAGDHLTRVRRTGQLVSERDGVYVQLGGSAAGLSADGGLSLLQYGDFDVEHKQALVGDRLPDDVANEVEIFIESNVFVWGYAEKAKRPLFTGAAQSQTLIVTEIPPSERDQP